MNWTLIAILIFIGINAILGMYKGIMKMAFSMIAMILVILATTFLAPKVTELVMDRTQFDEFLYERTQAYFEDQGLMEDATKQIDIQSLPLPKILLDQITKETSATIDAGVEQMNTYIITAVANIILTCIVYIGLFFVLWILAKIIELQLDFIGKIPVIKQVNGLAGFAVGALFGVFLVWVFFLVITIFSNSSFAHTVITQVKSNEILSYLYDKNVLLDLYFALK